MFTNVRVWIKGAGDLATGVAARLWRAGFPVVMTELDMPLTVRRSVSFSEAIYQGETRVEGIYARRSVSVEEINQAWSAGTIPILVDPIGQLAKALRPQVIVDAMMTKRNTGPHLGEAPLVIGLGPGFCAGETVDAVVETNRGHNLGRVYWSGSAEADTGLPGMVNGSGRERILYSPAEGTFSQRRNIGDIVDRDTVIGWVADQPVRAQISGVIRGLIHNGVWVERGLKLGDIDPRGNREYCYTISDKALAVGGGVLEAILVFIRKQ